MQSIIVCQLVYIGFVEKYKNYLFSAFYVQFLSKKVNSFYSIIFKFRAPEFLTKLVFC